MTPLLLVPSVSLVLVGLLCLTMFTGARQSVPTDIVTDALPQDPLPDGEPSPPRLFPLSTREKEICAKHPSHGKKGRVPFVQNILQAVPAKGTCPLVLAVAFPTPGDAAPLELPDWSSGGDENLRLHTELLQTPKRSATRSRQLEQIAREADRHTRYGFNLAGRKAYYSARAEFVKSLRLVAQSLDAEHRTRLHSRALGAGLTALEETDDFIPRGSRLEADLDLPGIIGGHRTPVLKDADPDNITPLEAIQCYFTYAQEQLGVSAGQEVAGSMALHGLGKLNAALARQPSGNIRAAESKAMTFYQAALLVCPRNYMAMNDLGVLLAHSGQFDGARTLLEHGISVRRDSTTWYNLAFVYKRLGRTRLARQAEYQWHASVQAEATRGNHRADSASGSVRWVDPRVFANSHTQSPGSPYPPPGIRRETTANVGQPKQSKREKIARGWPWDLFDAKRK